MITVMKVTGEIVPRSTIKPPTGSTETSVAGVTVSETDICQMFARIQSMKLAALSSAAVTNRSYEDFDFPNALMTSMPLMYSTAVLLSALVASTVR